MTNVNSLDALLIDLFPETNTQETRTASLEHLLAEARTKRAKAFMAQDRRAVDAWDREITRLWKRTQGTAGALL